MYLVLHFVPFWLILLPSCLICTTIPFHYSFLWWQRSHYTLRIELNNQSIMDWTLIRGASQSCTYKCPDFHLISDFYLVTQSSTYKFPNFHLVTQNWQTCQRLIICFFWVGVQSIQQYICSRPWKFIVWWNELFIIKDFPIFPKKIFLYFHNFNL